MSEQGVPIDEVTAKDFIMVRAALVRRLGGANEALVWSRIEYRANSAKHAHEIDGSLWWAASYEVIAGEVGLSRDQVKRAVAKLIEYGFLLAEKHHGSLQTISYSPVIIHRADSPDGVIPSGDIALSIGQDRPMTGAESPDAPSIKKVKKKREEESDVSDVDGFSDDVHRLSELLVELVTANGHKAKISEPWLRECDRLIRLDEYSVEQVEWVMRWACEQSTFWPANIRSMPKLREKFSTLKGQALADHARVKKLSTVEHGRSVDDILAARESELLAVGR